MNFRSIADMNECIVRSLPQLPRDMDLVVGIPRSGMLAASMLALHLNLPMTDVAGFIEGRALTCGLTRTPARALRAASDARKALIIDDSIWGGSQMDQVRDKVESSDFTGSAIYCAVYAVASAKHKVDIFLELCPPPRLFEWNFMHHPTLRHACVDIDGILCVDPSPEENDDGPRYEDFLQHAAPLRLPTVPLGSLVTCRLEKYRSLTEEWLRKHGVEYGQLLMMTHPDQASRRAAGDHAVFKAAHYRSTGAVVFIESSETQAVEIAQLSGLPVICTEGPQIVYPSTLPAAQALMRRAARGGLRRCKTAMAGFTRRLRSDPCAKP